jgi:hypothetical protein
LASSGEATPPCGVPISVFDHFPSGHARPQPFLNQAKYPSVGDAVLDELNQPFVRQMIEEATNVGIENPVHFLPHDPHPQRVQRLMLASPGPETI